MTITSHAPRHQGSLGLGLNVELHVGHIPHRSFKIQPHSHQFAGTTIHNGIFSSPYLVIATPSGRHPNTGHRSVINYLCLGISLHERIPLVEGFQVVYM